MSANDKQVGGAHYKGAVQHWDYAVAEFGTGYLKGQITKYVARWRKKNGVQDLEKALHFLQKLREVEHGARSNVSLLDVFANTLDSQDADIIGAVTVGDLRGAEEKLAALIAAEPTAAYVKQ